LLTLPAAAVLALRGVCGFAQCLFAPQASTPEFRRNDLRLYSPLCLALAAGLASLERTGGGSAAIGVTEERGA